jgi:hypothetical protein
VCDQLFDAADVDHSGGIDQQEFSHILAVLCAQILFRMAVYYVVLILLVPFVAAKVVDHAGSLIPNGSYLEMAAEQTIGLATFFGAIPFIWNIIDEGASKRVGEMAQAEANKKQSEEEEKEEKKNSADKKDE